MHGLGHVLQTGPLHLVGKHLHEHGGQVSLQVIYVNPSDLSACAALIWFEQVPDKMGMCSYKAIFIGREIGMVDSVSHTDVAPLSWVIPPQMLLDDLVPLRKKWNVNLHESVVLDDCVLGLLDDLVVLHSMVPVLSAPDIFNGNKGIIWADSLNLGLEPDTESGGWVDIPPENLEVGSLISLVPCVVVGVNILLELLDG